jgi:site-specific recombinase XerD
MTDLQIVSTTGATPIERLVDDFIINCRARGLSPRTIDGSYEPALRRVFLRWCRAEGIVEVSELDRAALDRFTAGLLSAESRYGGSLSKHTVHSYVRPVRQFLTWASSEGEAVRAKPQLPKLPRLHKDALSRTEIDRMESAAASERDRLAIRLFGDCGLRLSELLALETNSIIRSGRQAMLAVHGKGDRDRRVPIPPWLLRRIDRYIASLPQDRRSQRLFLSVRRGRAGEYEPLTDSGVKQLVRDAALRAGIGRTVHPHLLRHSWMTEMLRRGVNPLQLRVVAGASPEVIARHYEHLTQDDAYDAMIQALSYRKTPT